MHTCKQRGVTPVKVKGHYFGSYTHLAKVMRCSRRVATTGWKRGDLYDFKIKQVTWKEYLNFFKTATQFKCADLRKPMTLSESASYSKRGGYHKTE